MRLKSKTALIILILLCIVTIDNAFSKDIVTGVYGTWWDVREEMFKAAKENGFDVVISSDVERAQSMGLKCLYPLELTNEIVTDYAKWKSYVDKVKDTVTKYKHNTSVFGWYLADEPSWNEIPVDRYKEIYNMIKSIDEAKPTVAVLSLAKNWQKYLSIFDIIAIDPYLDLTRHYKDRETDKVKDWINIVNGEFLRQEIKKPLWVVLGAFEQNLKNGIKPAFRKPTPQEFNAMIEICLGYNVSGILVFSLFKAESKTNYQWNLLKDDPLLWETVRKLPDKVKNASQ